RPHPASRQIGPASRPAVAAEVVPRRAPAERPLRPRPGRRRLTQGVPKLQPLRLPTRRAPGRRSVAVAGLRPVAGTAQGRAPTAPAQPELPKTERATTEPPRASPTSARSQPVARARRRGNPRLAPGRPAELLERNLAQAERPMWATRRAGLRLRPAMRAIPNR